MTRAQTPGQQIRRSEYQESNSFQMFIADYQNRREYAMMESPHDFLTAAHQGAEFTDSGYFAGEMFLATAMTLADIEIDMNVSHPGHCAIISPITPEDFAADKALTLAVWRNHTRFFPPSAETTPSAW